MLLRLDGRGPLHRQIHRAVREGVLAGRLAPGSPLPPSRSLAAELGIARTVVVRAYERLAADGIVEARVGAGTYIRSGLAALDVASVSAAGTETPRLSAWGAAALELGNAGRDEDPPPYDFRYGRIDPEVFPRQDWRRAVRRALQRRALDYSAPEGSSALRSALATYLGRNRGVRCSPEQIVVVTGSQQALDLSARVLLDAGDVVLIEEPSYQGARHIFLAADAQLRLAPVDTEGIVLDGAADEVAVAPRLAYVTPSHQFPSGRVLSLPRRLALLDWARQTGAWVLEDDYDAEFRYDVPPVEAVHALDEDQRVLYAGTFSKVLFPALRIGYLVVPPTLVEAFRAGKWLLDRHTPMLEQEALAYFIGEGSYDRHLRRTRLVYARRRSVLLQSLARELVGRVRVVGANAGVHVLAWMLGLPLERLGALVEAARRRGVGVYPVTPYYAGAPPAAGLLLGYGALDEDRIVEGVRRLRAAHDEVMAAGHLRGRSAGRRPKSG